MTHQEIEIVLHLIDTYTQEKENGYCGMYGYSKYIDENSIRRLKSKIQEVFSEDERKNDRGRN